MDLFKNTEMIKFQHDSKCPDKEKNLNHLYKTETGRKASRCCWKI